MEKISTATERKSGKINWETSVPIAIFHILAVWALFTFSWANLIVFFIVWWLVGSVGIGLGFHRQLTHRGFQTPDWLKDILAVFGSMALQGSPIDWVTTHRLHHQFCETDQDPHSPRYGFFFSHIGWVLRGTSQDNSAEVEKRYVPDLLKDKSLVIISKYWYVPTILSGIILGFIGGWSMVLWGVFLPVTLNWHFTWFVNSVTHVWGSRRFEVSDDSTNNWWVALLSWGEGWHNNHHAHPTSVRHGLTWREIDINWIQIKTLEKLGLAWNLKEFNLKEYESKQQKGKLEIDETPEFWQQPA
ncbi:MAG: fatty acid desaturase [Pyrinomonadaceae bacterium]|nr:fatty acid desaturase [Pyrinomonadaceae bacterium]